MIFRIASLLAILLTAACATSDSVGQGPDAVAKLAAEIRALGPDVDPEEADRAARISYSYTRQLAKEYQITDPPLIHNTKVNMGLRPRGLCWQWAEDIERRLNEESFRTLQMHRAIANADNPYRIDHSTAIITQRGDGMYDGIILDPWRYGGRLHWDKTRNDKRYNWVPQSIVHDQKRKQILAKMGRSAPAL